MRDIITRVESSWKNWRKNYLQLDLDQVFIHRHVGTLVGFQLIILDVGLKLLAVEAPGRPALQNSPMNRNVNFEQTVPVPSFTLAPSFFTLQK